MGKGHETMVDTFYFQTKSLEIFIMAIWQQKEAYLEN
jgi:hypothetical protein